MQHDIKNNRLSLHMQHGIGNSRLSPRSFSRRRFVYRELPISCSDIIHKSVTMLQLFEVIVHMQEISISQE